MFSLAYPLDDSVVISGQMYTVNMSFDNIIRLIEMLGDNELNDEVKVEIGIEMLMGNVDFDIETKATILQKLFETVVAQKEVKAPLDIKGNPMPAQKEERVYSLVEDAEYIYASFMQDYQIDLFEQQGTLHWNKFKALLGGLRADTKFKEVLQIRQMELPTGKGTAKERKRIKEMQEAYELKGNAEF
ncbi:bacteriophage Gp15 family protein [Alkalicoccobacillus plakortidis]|uniref:Bacteriophage Gp15 family protein n=1 Tax=Alkalicoccobacillus plakortidis TaxID=444060 RepID=A0ABT0XI52_9BACI|nr:bacteriophage Gp15 family protein [Alkalicoccobacillus plakortidis]MCM2675547.1 bacteriophage Gp15 family protein [Alkalicoccobacillus plakortidis]